MNKLFLVIFFVINALFWGLGTHQQHCALVPMKPCPPHWVHLLMGLLSFMAAVYVKQKPYLDRR